MAVAAGQGDGERDARGIDAGGAPSQPGAIYWGAERTLDQAATTIKPGKASSEQFDAFIVLPVDRNAIVPVVKEAIAAGVKVVAHFNTIGSDIASIESSVPGMPATVAHPLGENGTIIAKLMVQACEGKDPCKVAYLPDSLSQATEGVRTKAVHAILKQSPNVKPVAEEGGYLRATSQKGGHQHPARPSGPGCRRLVRRSDDVRRR
ncbi:MAG: ABC-type sugar transport system periplasmic component-like protein [Conexibacter sp.]|nr:ABC-type sugar transport system periplasmic component-like protein [Conexibacter sp.]